MDCTLFYSEAWSLYCYLDQGPVPGLSVVFLICHSQFPLNYRVSSKNQLAFWSFLLCYVFFLLKAFEIVMWDFRIF